MNKTEEKETDVLALVTGVIFMIMGSFMLKTAVAGLFFVQDYSIYVFIGFALLILAFSSCLLLSKSKWLNTIIIVYVITVISICFIKKDAIQFSAIQSEYADINELMIKSYSGIIDLPIYKEFLVYKETNDLTRIKEYKDNLPKYISINPEKVMELKLFYTATNNKEIHSKLDEIFKDGLVTKIEYEDFKIFVYKLPLNSNEQSLLTIIQK